MTQLLATLPDGLSQKPTLLGRGSRTRSVGTPAPRSSTLTALDARLHRATWLMTAYMNRGWLWTEWLWSAVTADDPVGRLSAAVRYVRGAIAVRADVEPPDVNRTTFTVDFGTLRQHLFPKAEAAERPEKGLCCTPIRYEPPTVTTNSAETSTTEGKKK